MRLGPGDEARTEAFLRAHADSSAILRSNIARVGLSYSGRTFEGEYFGLRGTSAPSGSLEGLVAHAWNGMLVLQAPRGAAALAQHALRSTARPVAGLIGPWAQVESALTVPELAARPRRLSERELLMSLPVTELRVPSLGFGGQAGSSSSWRVRPPRADELAQVAQWRSEFAVEALGATASPETLATAVRELEAFHAQGDVFVLEVEGRIVATGTYNARLPDLVQFGSIYTPPEGRNRGYARVLVAGAVLAIPGLTRAVLFTKDPPAVRAYEAVGFRVTGDYGLVLFA